MNWGAFVFRFDVWGDPLDAVERGGRFANGVPEPGESSGVVVVGAWRWSWCARGGVSVLSFGGGGAPSVGWG